MNQNFLLLSFLLASLLGCQSTKETSTSPLTLEKIVSPNAKVEKLADGFNFLEGPIWDKKNNRLIFSEVGGNKLHQWNAKDGVSIFLDPSYYAGGNVLDREGNIISCQGGARQIAKIKPDQSMEILANSWEGKKFNSPNDVVVKSDGTIWFTDPDYGLLAAYGEKANDFREIDKYHIFVFDPKSKNVKSVYANLSKPNGLVFSKDEKKLYVGNSKEGDRKLIVFEVSSDNQLKNKKILANIESKTWGIDGLKMDASENLYAACGDGINIFTFNGQLIGKINTDFEVTNLCFGGKDNQTLFLTGHESLYKIHLNVKGK